MRTRITGRHRIGLGLGLLMALTRLSHFGHDFQPADASWAVFLLGGVLLPGGGSFFALCAEAGLLDLISLLLGVDRVCMSPAYLTLLPAYGVLWAGGRLAVRDGLLSYLRVGAASFVAASLAFVITNGGYFVLSPDAAAMPLRTFVATVSPSYPWYTLMTLGYSLVGCALARWVQRSAPAQHAVSSDVL